MIDTGPVIKIDTPPAAPLGRSSWRTLGRDSKRLVGWSRTDRDRCPHSCGGERRCMLVEGHHGLHAWRSLGGLRIFEWG